MLSGNLEKTLHAALTHAALRRHEYATLEHLLLALIDDDEAAYVLNTCQVNSDQLREDLTSFLDRDLAELVAEHAGDPKVTAGFQRVIQRAAIQGQSSGLAEITGANVLVALFSESQSHGVYFLQLQGLTESVVKAATEQRAGASAWVFVALPPGADAEATRLHGILPAIHATGHLAKPEEAASRIEMITHLIVQQIRGSRLVIADCTQPDRTVDFMMGLALGAGIPVIPICQAEEAAQYSLGDVRHHDMLIWHTLDELTEKLTPRIIAALGQSTLNAEGGDQAAEDTLPDTMTVAIRGLIERGRERGYVTDHEIEAILPSEQFPPEILEDTRTMLQQLGITIVGGGADSSEQ